MKNTVLFIAVTYATKLLSYPVPKAVQIPSTMPLFTLEDHYLSSNLADIPSNARVYSLFPLHLTTFLATSGSNAPQI